MAEASNVHPFDQEAEWDDQDVADCTCPDCGRDSVVTYLDRYSTYEYCTSCEWSEDDGEAPVTIAPITRRDRRVEGL